MISMIPLELRRRRIERAVLTQFGDMLDDAALRELATGPLIQRLSLRSSRSDGLDECTREMFSLAMLVRLGKVTEDDIRETFAVFRRLDVNDEGVLNSKSIIAAMIQKRRQSSARVMQQRRVNESSISTASKSANNVNSQFAPYWPMPVPALPGSFDQQASIALLPENPVQAPLQPSVPAHFMAPPAEAYGSLPNERAGLLLRTNST